MRDYSIPNDYGSELSDRVIILTGAARSGTSILGKIVGSMEETFYFFEPALAILLGPALRRRNESSESSEAFLRFLRATLFEDFFLQRVHGRNLNFNRNDLSFVGNYEDQASVEERWESLNRRSDALNYLSRHDAQFVLKIPDCQPLVPELLEVFPGAQIVEILRNGFDVVGSSVKRGWFGDDYLEEMVNWVRSPDRDDLVPVPWFLDDVSSETFYRWNPETRAARFWGELTRMGTSHRDEYDTVSRIKYERLLGEPRRLTRELATLLGLEQTKKTDEHIDTIEDHRASSYPDVVERIEPDERARVQNLMSAYGYAREKYR